MVMWISTAVMCVVFAWIIVTEVRCGRRSNAKLATTNREINTLAKSTFDRHKALFGREPTGAYPIVDVDKK